MMERRVTRAGMGAVVNFHGSLGRNNRQRKGGGKTTWNKVDQSWWGVICELEVATVILKVSSDLNGSAIPNRAVPHILAQLSSLPGKSSMPVPRSGRVNKEKMVLELLFDVKIPLYLLLKWQRRENGSICQLSHHLSAPVKKQRTLIWRGTVPSFKLKLCYFPEEFLWTNFVIAIFEQIW